MDALEAVALKFLREMGSTLDEATRTSLVSLCQAFHSRITEVSAEFLAVSVGLWCLAPPAGAACLALVQVCSLLLGLLCCADTRGRAGKHASWQAGKRTWPTHDAPQTSQITRSHGTHNAQDLGRNNYVTPTSYLELITSFRSLLEARRSANSRLKSRYLVGLEKLAGSAEQVAGMQAELRALQPQLVATVAEVRESLGCVVGRLDRLRCWNLPCAWFGDGSARVGGHGG